MNDYYLVEPCNTAGGFEIKLKNKKLDIKKCESTLSKIGEIIACTQIVLLAKIDSFSVSFYASGRMMIKSDRKIDKKPAQDLAQKIMNHLSDSEAII